MAQRPRFQAYPKRGAITIADGDIYPLNVGGNFVSIKSADQDFTLRLDDENEYDASVNRKFRLDESDSFKKVEVVNDSGSDLTFQIEIGFGDVDTNDIAINAAVGVKNADAPNDKLAVDDADTQAAIAALQTEVEVVKTSNSAMLAAIQGDDTARQALTDLSNCDYAQVTSTVSTIVTSAANVNGIMLRLATVSAWGTGSGNLTIGGKRILYGIGNNTPEIRDVKLPAGEELASTSNDATSVRVFYEIL